MKTSTFSKHAGISQKRSDPQGRSTDSEENNVFDDPLQSSEMTFDDLLAALQNPADLQEKAPQEPLGNFGHPAHDDDHNAGPHLLHSVKMALFDLHSALNGATHGPGLLHRHGQHHDPHNAQGQSNHQSGVQAKHLGTIGGGADNEARHEHSHLIQSVKNGIFDLHLALRASSNAPEQPHGERSDYDHLLQSVKISLFDLHSALTGSTEGPGHRHGAHNNQSPAELAANTQQAHPGKHENEQSEQSYFNHLIHSVKISIFDLHAALQGATDAHDPLHVSRIEHLTEIQQAHLNALCCNTDNEHANYVDRFLQSTKTPGDDPYSTLQSLSEDLQIVGMSTHAEHAVA